MAKIVAMVWMTARPISSVVAIPFVTTSQPTEPTMVTRNRSVPGDFRLMGRDGATHGLG
jgi:hypothetical protein